MCLLAPVVWPGHAREPLEVANDNFPPADGNEAGAFPCAQDGNVVPEIIARAAAMRVTFRSISEDEISPLRLSNQRGQFPY